jgi:hypothetical protein
MRFARKACRGIAATLTMAMAAGCASGTSVSGPVSGLVSVYPAAAASRAESGSAGPVPPAFAASFGSAKQGNGGDRVALLSSRTGQRLRWLTRPPAQATDEVLSVRDDWVYFVRYPIDLTSGSASPSPAIWRVRLTGGQAELVQAGASGYAVSPDGRAVAYVTSADHGNVAEIVARNPATGRRNTIVMSTRPDPGANNWPPNVSGLTWAPDDAHLAVQFELTAAIGSVLVFDAFTASTITDGRAAPALCTVASYQCEEGDPAYLASGELSYVIQRVSRAGASQVSLAAWPAGGRASTRLSFPRGMRTQAYGMTARGQAIWASGPARPGGPWTIWRWSGGAPVRVITLPPPGTSPYYGIDAIAW